MDSIRLTGTDESPEVVLNPATAEFKFSGKSLPEDVKEFYNPILNWIEEYTKAPIDETVIEFKMEYFNSASSKQILDILERFAKINETGKAVKVKWLYIEDDEDMAEAGESYGDIVDIPFEIIPYE